MILSNTDYNKTRIIDPIRAVIINKNNQNNNEIFLENTFVVKWIPKLASNGPWGDYKIKIKLNYKNLKHICFIVPINIIK